MDPLLPTMLASSWIQLRGSLSHVGNHVSWNQLLLPGKKIGVLFLALILIPHHLPGVEARLLTVLAP